MDITSVGSLLTSLKTATDIVKFIRDSEVSIERAELKLKLAELVEALANAKLEAADIKQSIVERDELIRELRTQAQQRELLKWEQPCYYLTNEEGVKEPYCQNCHDSTGKLSRLHDDGHGEFECRVCTQTFRTKERIASDQAAHDAATRDYRGSRFT